MTAHAERVKVRLFCNATIEAMYVSFDLGLYDLYGGTSEADIALLEPELGEGMSVELKPTAGGVTVSVNSYLYGTFPQVQLRASDTACILCLKPLHGLVYVDRPFFKGNIFPLKGADLSDAQARVQADQYAKVPGGQMLQQIPADELLFPQSKDPDAFLALFRKNPPGIDDVQVELRRGIIHDLPEDHHDA